VVLWTTRQQVRRSSTRRGDKKWILTKLDAEKLETALMATSWGLREEEGRWDIQQEVDWLRESMQRVCDEAMPRAKSHPPEASDILVNRRVSRASALVGPGSPGPLQTSARSRRGREGGSPGRTQECLMRAVTQ